MPGLVVFAAHYLCSISCKIEHVLDGAPCIAAFRIGLLRSVRSSQVMLQNAYLATGKKPSDWSKMMHASRLNAKVRIVARQAYSAFFDGAASSKPDADQARSLTLGALRTLAGINT